MNPEQLFDDAMKTAEFLVKIKPLVDAISENPMDAAIQIISLTNKVGALEKQLKEIKEITDAHNEIYDRPFP